MSEIFNEEETPEEKKKSHAVNSENMRIYESEIGNHAVKSKHGEYKDSDKYEWDRRSWVDTNQSTGYYSGPQEDKDTDPNP